MTPAIFSAAFPAFLTTICTRNRTARHRAPRHSQSLSRRRCARSDRFHMSLCTIVLQPRGYHEVLPQGARVIGGIKQVILADDGVAHPVVQEVVFCLRSTGARGIQGSIVGRDLSVETEDNGSRHSHPFFLSQDQRDWKTFSLITSFCSVDMIRRGFPAFPLSSSLRTQRSVFW